MATRFGKYILLHKLAVGGMAELYLAKQTGLEGFEKLVVLKKILAQMTEQREFVEMFVNEARIAARLNHPNIVQIYDLGRVTDSYFIAMEYVYGEDLRTVAKATFKKRTPFPFEHLAKIMSDVMQGLHFAHTRTDGVGAPLHIVHRDVSPQNIIVTYDGGVKIVDFGIAKATLTPMTTAGVIKGKYAYMSPEQCRGEKLDGKADIFSAGIILYELLTGIRLFRRETDFATLKAVTDSEITPPRILSPVLPAELERITLKALARDRAERYQTAEEMQLDLEEFIRKNQYQTGNVAIGKVMREIFADKLAMQAAAIRQAQADSLESLLLDEQNLEVSIITGVPDLDDQESDPLLAAAPLPPRRSLSRPGLPVVPPPPTVGRPLPPLVSSPDPESFFSPSTDAERLRVSSGPQVALPGAMSGGPERQEPPAEHVAAHDQETFLFGDPKKPADPAAPPWEGPSSDQETDFDVGARVTASGSVPRLGARTDLPGELPGDAPEAPGDIHELPTVYLDRGDPVLAQVAIGTGGHAPVTWLTRNRMIQGAVAAAVLLLLAIIIGKLAGREKLASVTIRSFPGGAQITLNGLPMSARTPARLNSVPAGRNHQLSLTLPGFKAWESAINPEAGPEPTPIVARLVPIGGALAISSSPSEAEVELDGEPRGQTPALLIELKPGTHRLVLRKGQLAFAEPALMLIDGELKELSCELKASVVTRETARLSLTTSVPARVTLGERTIGTTPLKNVEVPAGELTLTLTWKKKRQVRKRTVSLSPKAGQELVESIDLSEN